MKFVYAILIFATANVSSGALAQAQKTVIPNFPVSDADCPAKASELKVAFERATSISVFAATCERADNFSFGGRDIVFSYGGTRSVSFGTVLSDPLYRGYATLAECNERRGEQEAFFTQETGLTPFTSYCRAGSIGDRNGYLYIAAFPRAARQRYTFSGEFGGEFSLLDVWLEDQATVAEDIRDAITALGARVARVRVDHTYAVVDYYADGPLHLEFDTYAGYASDEDCQAELPTIRSMVATFGTNVVAQFCAPTDDHPMPRAAAFSLLHDTIAFNFFQIHHLYRSVAPGMYPTLVECNADRERVRQFYRRDLRHDVYVVQCSIDEDTPHQYRNLVFSRVRAQ